jgi:hypothetical protein
MRSLKPVTVDADMHITGTLHSPDLETESLQATHLTFGNPMTTNALRILRTESGRLKLLRHNGSGWKVVTII